MNNKKIAREETSIVIIIVLIIAAAGLIPLLSFINKTTTKYSDIIYDKEKYNTCRNLK